MWPGGILSSGILARINWLKIFPLVCMDQYMEAQSTLLALLPHNVYYLLSSTLPSSHLIGLVQGLP